jgi:hypothetical protein
LQAVYSVKEDPITWDFGTFLVGVMTKGCTGVTFAGEKISARKFGGESNAHNIAHTRFQNILVGLCELAGVPWERNSDRTLQGLRAEMHAGDLNRLFLAENRIWKFPKVESENTGYVTVTLRESFRNQCRNSNRPAWDRFIKDLRDSGKEVIVLEDAEKDPPTVRERMKLYSNADMNYGVNNGPMILCICSDSPYKIFNWIPRKDELRIWEKHTASGGFPRGSQFLFRNENQKIIWEHDDYEVLMRNL